MKKTLLVLLLLLSKAAIAKDFGVCGNTYPIIEPNFLNQIQVKLEAMDRSGQMVKLQKEIQNKTVEAISRPKPITGIARATVSREWLFDPSIVLDHDLKDQNGRVFYYAGTKINPLEKISMSKSLIFIDGDDQKQIKWALKQNKAKNNNVKIILIKGAAINLMKHHKIRFYFDQNGCLTKKFNIKFVPAIVEQERQMLKIKEVVL